MAELDDDDEEKGGSAEWMATFSDMVTLLLTFFILMYSMSVVDKKKFEATFSSVRDSFGGDQMENIKTTETSEEEAQMTTEMVRVREEMLEAQRITYNEIRSFITQEAMEDQVTAILDEGKIILRVPTDVLFAPSSELLSLQAERALSTLLTVFQEERDQTINIKGYSDNSPIASGSRFYDNWELSALRAVNILRFYLNAGVDSHRITATGMGELDPLFPNDTAANRAKNRRVEFVLEKEIKNEN